MIAFFSKEKGAEKVKEILENAALSKCSVLMHSASVAELYYDTLKTSSIEAESMIMNLKTYPITFIENITTDLIKQIGFFKTNYKISFADSFVLATAKIYAAKVVTSDHHEFDVIEKRGDVAFEWIR